MLLCPVFRSWMSLWLLQLLNAGKVSQSSIKALRVAPIRNHLVHPVFPLFPMLTVIVMFAAAEDRKGSHCSSPQWKACKQCG